MDIDQSTMSMAEAKKKWAELPEKPTGWTRQMTLHMSVEGGGIGVFSIFDPDKALMPIGYGYNTSPGGMTGFMINGVAGEPMSWAALREEWKKPPTETNQEIPA